MILKLIKFIWTKLNENEERTFNKDSLFANLNDQASKWFEYKFVKTELEYWFTI